MTRKKSRPQHRENVSSKSVNEGGFYKMFWDNLEGDEATNASPQSPDVIPRNSPSVIVINDSDDENPYTIEESSGDILGTPLPIKKELLLETSAGNKERSGGQECNIPSELISRNSPSVIVINGSDDENPYTIDETSCDTLETPLPIKQELSLETKTSAANKDQNADQSDDDIPSEKTIEDGVISTLQPTSLGQSSSASLCVASINSLPLLSDQRTLPEDLRSPNRTNSPEDSRSVSQDRVVNYSNLILELTVDNSEHLIPPCEASSRSEPQAIHGSISTEPQSIQENGDPLREFLQVSSISSPFHQIDDLSGNELPIPLGNEPVVNENRCEEKDLPVDEQLVDNTGSTQAMSERTGQALELLKSLLVSTDEEDPNYSTSINNDEVNMDVDINREEAPIISVTDYNLHDEREITKSQFTRNNVYGNSKDPTNVPVCSPSDHALGVPVAPVTSHVDFSSASEPAFTDLSEPTVIHQEEPAIINELKDASTDEFPTYGHILPYKIKIEPIAIRRSLDLLRKELLALYNNCDVKIAFENKTDNEVVDEGAATTENEEVDLNIPITPPCRVMVERLPTPMVLKGYVALCSKSFQKWKLRIIRLRNEEKFRHLGVWRRGRTRLWRECQLAGMDKASYDKQVAYIAKHEICETSSSSSSDEFSDGETNTSIDNIFDDSFRNHSKAVDDSSADESDVSELNSQNRTSPSTPEKLQSVNSTNFDVSDLTVPKSDATKCKLVGPKSFDKDVSPSRDEYIVERSTVHEDTNSEGKKTAPLKITIRKTSVNKSEDEREKSVESEVENSFTVPPKPANKRVKRTFVTKRTYRKPEEPHPSPSSTLTENDTQKSSLFEPSKKRSMPHYVEDNNENEESLLGRRSHEVENFNLLEKWDIPFEEPTLFRSPRVASRLAQIKTKEAFSRKNYVRQQPIPPKVVALCKDVKEVVEMLCSKTVEAMLLPDAISNSFNISDSDNHPKLVNLAPKVHGSIEAEGTALHEIPSVATEKVQKTGTCEEDDASETLLVTHYETSSTIDTSEYGDSPKKGTVISPTARKKKRPYGYRRRRGNRAKPSCKINDTSSTDEKIDADVVSTKLVPKVVLLPLQSTQVPVVSEGPGQSPQESEEDFLQPEDIVADIGKVESENKAMEKSTKLPLDKKDELFPEKSQMASHVRNTRSKQPVLVSDDEDVVSPRITRSKQPTITIDPEVLENFGIRKINRKCRESLDKKNNTSENKDEPKAASTEQTRKFIQRKKGKGKSSLPQDSPAAADAVSMESKDSDTNLTTQVHEISEGPGEVVDLFDSIKQPLQIEIPKNNDYSANKKLKPANSGLGIQDSPKSPTSDAPEKSSNEKHKPANSIQGIPDSPMSPTSDAPENDVVQPRITRSKNRMLRGGMGYITVKPTTSNYDQQDSESFEDIERNADSDKIPLVYQCGTMSVAASEKTQEEVSKDSSKRKNEVGLSSTTVENTSPILEDKESPDLSECGKVQKLGSELRNDSTAESEPDPVTNDSDGGNKTKSVNVVTHSDSGSELITNNSTMGSDPNPMTNNSTTESGLLVARNSTTEVSEQKTDISKEISDTIVSLILGPLNRKQPPTATPNSPLHAGEIVSELQATIKNDTKRSPIKVVSPEPSESSGSPLHSNPSRGRQEVLETLNSILKLSSQNKKIADSLTAAGNNNPFEKKEAIVDPKNASDDEFDSGDAADGLVVDEDRDFSDDDENSAELASRIDQIIKDQIKIDNEPGGAKKAATGKEKDSLGKRRDSIDERTGLPTTILQKLRDPRIRSKLLSQFEDNEDLTAGETVTTHHQPLNPTESKALINETQVSTIRDPRAIRGTADPRRRVETSAIAPEPTVGAASNNTVENVSNLLPTTAVPKVGENIVRDAVNPSAILSGAGNPPALARSSVNTPTGLKSTVTPVIPRGPLLPTPAALIPTIAALRHATPTIHPAPNNTRTGVTLSYVRPGVTPTSEFVDPNKADDIDDCEEESLKRRPKKQKKDLDTELMYKSPLEDLQSEARPTYDRTPSRGNGRYDGRSFMGNKRGRRNSNETTPSRWDVRHNVGRRERDNLHYPESQQTYNQDRWGRQQINGSINQTPSDGRINPTPWKHSNWYPEQNAHPNDTVHQEPRLSYMDTRLLNLSLLPKTTNLNTPPFTKIYASFNHGNPQILGIAPPTYDPKEKASTITMMDPMGQEMIDIIQLPRPTSGLTSDYFNDLPDEFCLEELITHPYLALSDMMDEEVEIENHGINIFNDSDEERKIVRGNLASRRHANDPRNQSSVLLEKTDKVNNVESKNTFAPKDPLENILHCLPALKEQYAFKKSKLDSISDPWEDDSDKLVAPPPPTWSNEVKPEPKKMGGKITSTLGNDESAIDNWRNTSPPKKKISNKSRSPARRSRSKSPLHRTRRRSASSSPSRLWSPGRWKRSRSRSPYSKGRSRSRSPYSKNRSRSRSPYSKSSRAPSTRSTSPSYRTRGRSRSRSRDRSRSRGRSSSNSLERLGRIRMKKRSRTRSPGYHRSSNSPSRKRHSRR